MKQRAVIQFCVNLGKTPVETLEMINCASKKPAVCRSLVYKWHRRYSDGRDSVQDNDRSGRPVTQTTSEDVNAVKSALDSDRRRTLTELCELLDMSYGTVRRIIKDELKMSRVCARWVPRLLKAVEMERRVEESIRFLERFDKEGDRFLEKIITTDETWLFYHDPETKQQSSQWKTSESPPPKKARTARSMGKCMFIAFFDMHGPILLHAVPSGRSVTGSYYSKVR